MAIVSKPYTLSNGATIYAAEHNSNYDTLYNDYNGNITNANLASNAAIVGTKLDLTSVGAIGSTSPNTGKFTTTYATSSTAVYISASSSMSIPLAAPANLDNGMIWIA